MMAKVHKGILGLMNVVFYIMIEVIVTGIHLCQYKVHFKEREIMSAIEKLELILWGFFFFIIRSYNKRGTYPEMFFSEGQGSE